MKALSIAVFLGIVSYLQIKKMLAEKQKKELLVYIGLMVIAAYLSIGSQLDFYIPNPTNGIKLLFEPVQSWVDKLLS